MESKPNKPPEGQPDDGGRNILMHLGGLGAAAGLAALGISETEAKSKTEGSMLESGVLGYFLFGGFDKTEDQKKRDEIVEKVKDQNATIEYEKTLLSKLNFEKISEINDNPSKAEEIVRSIYFKDMKDASIAAGTAFTVGVAGGAEVGRRNRKDGIVEGAFEGAVGGAIVGGIVAAGILLNQPTMENGKAAEKNLLTWIKEEMRLVGSISRGTMNERIEDLTKLQKKNSFKIAAL